MTTKSKVRSLIIDDSPFIIETLSDILQTNHVNVEVIGTASTGTEGLEMISRLKPDLVFLDVEMPDFNGFEMLSRVEEISFQTIFITSFSHYAISAIRFNALDYLLKPIDPDDLGKAIKRFEQGIESRSNQKNIIRALNNFETKDAGEQMFVLATQEGEIVLKLKDIMSIEGDRNYSKIQLLNGKTILSSKNLKLFEDLLADKGFFRCHRSHLVNREYITSIKGELVVLSEGIEVPVSRRKKSQLKMWLNGGD